MHQWIWNSFSGALATFHAGNRPPSLCQLMTSGTRRMGGHDTPRVFQWVVPIGKGFSKRVRGRIQRHVDLVRDRLIGRCGEV
jgi:hypothetical protein